MSPTEPAQEADASATGLLSLYQPRTKIQPRAVDGRFARLRWVMVWITQLVFYGLPWLMWNQRPAVLLDLNERRFYIFKLVLYPQDLIFLTAILLISAYGLFLFTAVAGRLWCGYACPQTVYTEIFMWIERKFEGDRTARLRLDKSGWSAGKLMRRGGKHAAWLLFSLWTGFTLVGYFTPIRGLAVEILAGTTTAWETFWVLFYALATYGFAGFMREQVCKYMCPYARFQGAMFDRDTLVITYEGARGEPRGPRSRKADPQALGLGDCVDCTLCVQVCPTGIDIRNGQQYECIGCAACIDVCDEVMDKVGYPRGLIRYDTLRGIEEGLDRGQVLHRMVRPRVLVYSAIMGVIVTAFLVGLYLRPPFRADVVRDRSSLARIVGDGWIENVYRLQIMNTTERTQSYQVTADGLPGLRVAVPQTWEVEGARARWVVLSLRVPPETAMQAQAGAHPVVFHVHRLATSTDATYDVDEKSTFVLPR